MRPTSEALEELEVLCSPLASVNPTSPFSIPTGYFDQLPARILLRLNQHEGVPYEVADAYFNDAPQRFLSAALAESEGSKAPPKQLSLVFTPLQRAVEWTAAAMLVLFMGLGALKNYRQPTVSHAALKPHISDEQIVGYLVNNLDDLDPLWLEEQLHQVVTGDASDQLSTQEIREYLYYNYSL